MDATQLTNKAIETIPALIETLLLVSDSSNFSIHFST